MRLHHTHYKPSCLIMMIEMEVVVTQSAANQSVKL